MTGFRVSDSAGRRIDATALFVENTRLATFDRWLALGNVDARVDVLDSQPRLFKGLAV